MKRIRLVLADDHPIVLDGLEQLFAMEGDLEVVARASSGEGALRALEEFRPDVLVLDLAMPDHDGLWVMQQAAHHPTKRASSPGLSCPPTGPAFGRPDDRLRRASSNHKQRW